MTITEMHSWFDVLQMKGNDQEFTRAEKDHLINRAQLKYVNEVLQKKYLPSLKAKEGSKVKYSPIDSGVSGRDAITPLIGLANLIASSGSASIDFSDIETTIKSTLTSSLGKSSTFIAKLMMITGVRHRGGLQCRFQDTTNTATNHFNLYRKALDFQPTYILQEHRINIEPNSLGGEEFAIGYIREPELVKWSHTSADRVDCELPGFTHDEIIAIALDDAGLAQRDQALMQLNKANKDNLSEVF